MEIHYSTTGFIHDVTYTAHLSKICLEFDADFGNLQTLNVELKEILPQHVGVFKDEPISFSADNTVCNIKLTFFQYRNEKGKITGKPSPFDVFEQLRFILRRAVKLYNGLT